jgi:hypothetical protein
VDEPKFIGSAKPIGTAQLDAVVHVVSSFRAREVDIRTAVSQGGKVIAGGDE